MPDMSAQSLLSRHLMAIAEYLEGLSTRIAKLEKEITGQEEKMQRYMDRFLEQVASAVRELEQAGTESSKQLTDLEGKLSSQQATIARLGSLDDKMGLLNVKIEEELTGMKQEVDLLKKWVDNELKLDESLLRRLGNFPQGTPHSVESKPMPQSK